MKNFAIIGAAGYIAPRHMKAIKETGNNLIAAFDPNDSVGIIDSYFPDAAFFTEFERFDRHLEKLKRKGTPVDCIVVCSPNYLHDAHIRFGLRIGADVICEKPVVLKPHNLTALIELEKEYPGKVYAILQLRLHPAIVELKKEIDSAPMDTVFEVDLKYITSRGVWYQYSWKGDQRKSGGIAMNIGIHFFDLLLWLFGDVEFVADSNFDEKNACGNIILSRAMVKYSLSVDYDNIPDDQKQARKRAYRSLTIDGKEFEFSEGFEDLHTKSYQEILNGNGFGMAECKPAIELVNRITDTHHNTGS